MPLELTYNRLSIEVLCDVGADRERLEEQLVEGGMRLALPHRIAWARAHPDKGSLFVTVRDQANAMQAAFAVQVEPSRALPGFRLLRVERFGASRSPEAREAGCFAVAELARRYPRVLRAYIEVFSPLEQVRVEIAKVARTQGFKASSRSRCSAHTLFVDLTPTESEILASLPKKTRRDIRAAEKHAVEVRPIRTLEHQGRLASLLRETMLRTAGEYDEPRWEALIELCNKLPDSARLVGLFRTDVAGPDALLAFAFARHHGDHAEYATAGSTRETALRLPLAYPLVWDLMCWAKRNGAKYLDLGGVSDGSMGSADALGGISDFKRYFSQQRVEVGAEWMFEPRWLPAMTAKTISATAISLRRLRASLSQSAAKRMSRPRKPS
jgi:hypothetical protein